MPQEDEPSLEELERRTAVLWERWHDVLHMGLSVADDFDKAKNLLWSAAADRRNDQMPEWLFAAVDQFLICAASLKHAQSAGEVSSMGSWSAWALADTPVENVGKGQQMEMWWLGAFRMYPGIWTCPAFQAACLWYFCGLFDFARQRSAYKEICEDAWDFAMDALSASLGRLPNLIDPGGVYLGCYMLVWAARESPAHAKDLASDFEEAVDKPWLPEGVRAVYCKILSTVASNFTSKPAAHWSERATREFSEHLSNFDKVQMEVTSLFASHNVRADAKALIEKMTALRAERSEGKTPLAATIEAAHTVQYIQPLFDRLLTHPAADLFLSGLQAWYCQESQIDTLDAETMLFTVAFGLTDSFTLYSGERRVLTRDTQELLIRMNQKMSEFLGTYTTVAGADNSKVPIPERHGMVSKHTPGLAEVLRETYCPDGLEPEGNPQSQLILPMEGHPIQATQLATWGRTWPIASSLNQARPDRPPKNVLLWCGAVYSGGMELEMVKAAFEGAGAQVSVVSPTVGCPDEFIKTYEDSSYDVLWIASHGDYDHFAPHKVKLHLALDGANVMLDDLWTKAPNTEHRRLLVLNVCDGARFADKGMLPRIGLAAGLSCPSQATISHLWPVRPLPSAGFGALLAHHLAEGLSYFEAYCATLKALQKPAAQVGAELEALYGSNFELVGALRRSDDDFSGIETWGSAAFYQ